MVNKPDYCLGTVQWGLDYGISNKNGMPGEIELKKIIEVALAHKITHLDTAGSYGSSETRIGNLLPDTKNKFHITTKLDFSIDVFNSGKDKVYLEVHRLIDRSLKRLKVRKLDTVLFHKGHLATSNNMIAWKILQEIQNDGIIGKIGFSAANPTEAKLVFELPGCQVVQVASSILDQRLSRTGFFNKTRELGVETFVRSIFLQGLAFMDAKSLQGRLKILIPTFESFKLIARELGIKIPDLWRIYAQNLDSDFLVIGTTNHKELAETLSCTPTQELATTINDFAKNLELYSDNILDPYYWGPEETQRLFPRMKTQ